MSETALPRSAPILQRAMACMQQEDYAGAEAILQDALKELPDDANLLHLMGLARLQQHHHEEAAPYLQRSIALSPRHALTRLNYGKLLVLMGQDEQAAESFKEAVRLKPELTEAHLELGNALQRLQRPREAEVPLRTAMRQAPANALAKLSLGGVLLEIDRHAEAETVTAEGLAQTDDDELRAKLYNNLGLAQRQLRKEAAALDSFEKAQELAPYFIHLDVMRAGLLQNLNRNEEALAALEMILEREPQDLESHYNYNSLLYRLGRDDEFLKSLDKAPRSRDVLMAKANLALKVNRDQEALDAYAEILTGQPDDMEALAGISSAYSKLDRVTEAVAAMEKAAALAPDHPFYLGHLSGTLIRGGDPERAAATALRAMELEPLNQSHIALLSAAWRMMDDPRDEDLAGYDDLIRIFELEPPKGFASMESFNAALLDELSRLHPDTREYFDQSLRFGTQTPDTLFGAGHEMVEALHGRIVEAVTRYIKEIPRGNDHIFAKRRTRSFRFAGSWSSRLKDCGFHTDHIHPGGWISSCYYAGLPSAVQDKTEKQGWIKFGQASMRPDLSIRRAIQPREGRLILFPSYMWHGTIPFQSQKARTTVAFDVLPS